MTFDYVNVYYGYATNGTQIEIHLTPDDNIIGAYPTFPLVLVKGSDGSTYYSDTHYGKLREPAFQKITK